MYHIFVVIPAPDSRDEPDLIKVSRQQMNFVLKTRSTFSYLFQSAFKNGAARAQSVPPKVRMGTAVKASGTSKWKFHCGTGIA